MNFKNLKLISGDASFRKFYKGKKGLIVHSIKEKKSNLLIYNSINEILIKNKIKAPKLISQNYKKNYIEIEYLGKNSVYKKIMNNKKKRFIYYKKIIFLLKKIQKIKNKKIITFLNTHYTIPTYSRNLLFKEACLFTKWYLPKIVAKKKQSRLKIKFHRVFKKILNNLKGDNNTFVHRDFHVSNLLLFKNNIGVIDSQDALYGNRAYDLASLIDDVRIRTSFEEKKKIYNEFIKINKNINHIKFKNDFEILSVLRNFKIIGIFTRLSQRDKKKQYLKLIPYAWKMIEMRVFKNEKFSEIKNLIDLNFPKQQRIIKK
tara:strand:+ start:419 stop:1366 length:948 start_codon:yes stop_codon:yes gene_type:complete